MREIEGFNHYSADNGIPTITRGLESIEAAVTDFHEKFGQRVGSRSAPEIRDHLPRRRLIAEELEEFDDACYEGNLVEAVDALGDLLYAIMGGFVTFGVEPGPILEEIHRSNMTKCSVKRADGKVTKGDKYEPPDIAGCLDAQRDYYTLAPSENIDTWAP